MRFKSAIQRSLGTLQSALLVTSAVLSGSCDATTLIQNVRLFDGEKMQTPRQVLIDQGKIIDTHFKGKITSAMQLVDGRGRTLLPGLIDTHVHAFQDQDLPLLFGVTTQIDMFSSVQAMRDMHKTREQATGRTTADIFSAGILATAPKGHGTEYGIEIDTITRPEQAAAWVDRRLAEGSHFIKIVMEHGAIGMPFNSLDLRTVEALIEASHARGKLAVVHISTYDDAKAALAAGADGLVHLFNGANLKATQVEELVRLAKKRSAFIIPSFSVLESMAGIRAEDILNDQSILSLLSKNQRMPLKVSYGSTPHPDSLNAPRQVTAALYKAKVPVLAGTDAGNRGTQYGVSLHHEMAALVDAGLPPIAALRAATSAAAKAFQLNDRGHIKNGYKADLLLVDGDPSEDIRSTRRIINVWKNGESVASLRHQKRVLVSDEQNKMTSAIDLPKHGRISLFSQEEGAKAFASPFGIGWMPSNDATMGGHSTVALRFGESEPDGQASMQINASIQPGFAFPWAGVVFFPAQQAMQPADLSNANTLKFKVKGDGKIYNVGFTMQGSFIPLNINFKASPNWQEISIPFSRFKGLDPSIITMLSFNAGPTTGEYQFLLADVRLTKE
ncbi:CIA30 family protein [Undibacterium fentianense]|uniref:CIA30 family protein n=1 Tax=Undibacterium fentianense TaxID=2828728 RepID=A0A941E327_9BURK|nr:CIA30 family protein [Undibacterium fentianense]MBR7801410.1 CIA30 family protein [Undibacterium fentianense]